MNRSFVGPSGHFNLPASDCRRAWIFEYGGFRKPKLWGVKISSDYGSMSTPLQLGLSQEEAIRYIASLRDWLVVESAYGQQNHGHFYSDRVRSVILMGGDPSVTWAHDTPIRKNG